MQMVRGWQCYFISPFNDAINAQGIMVYLHILLLYPSIIGLEIGCFIAESRITVVFANKCIQVRLNRAQLEFSCEKRMNNSHWESWLDERNNSKARVWIPKGYYFSEPGGRFNIKCHLTNIGITVLKIRRSRGRLIFIMGIQYLGKTVFILRDGPGIISL